MKKEEVEGPVEVLKKATKYNERGERILDEAILMEYERDRLKYYYAIIYFKDKKTAEMIYD